MGASTGPEGPVVDLTAAGAASGSPDLGGVGGGGAPDATDVRSRILSSALRLMAEGGLHGTSMRALAGDVGVNVATLYHYFPSKQAIFDEAVAEQHEAMLTGEPPAVDPDAPAEERLEALLVWLLHEIDAQGEHIWRLMLGESLRGEPTVREVAARLSAAFEELLADWLAGVLPEVGDRAAAERLARTLRAAVYGVIVESLLEDDGEALLEVRAAELAATLAPVVVTAPSA